jgi:hypothetical protein
MDQLCQIFNVRSPAQSDVAILKISFLPGEIPGAAKAVYSWIGLFEKLLETDVESFFHFCQREWEKITSNSNRTSSHPLLWRMFTPESFDKLIGFNMDMWFDRSFEHFDQMEVQSVNNVVTLCSVWWKANMNAAIGVPSSILVAMRPVTASYNPFELSFQNPFKQKK